LKNMTDLSLKMEIVQVAAVAALVCGTRANEIVEYVVSTVTHRCENNSVTAHNKHDDMTLALLHEVKEALSQLVIS
jgi:hypothetical protein